MTVEQYRPFPLVLETWRRPSFEPAWSWGVYVPITDEPVPEAWVLAVSSRLPIDFRIPECLAHPLSDLGAEQLGSGPLRARTVELPKLKFRNLLRIGRRIAVPVNVELPQSIGLDGTSYGFRSGARYDAARVSLEWWEEGPKEWRAFAKWVVELQEFLAKCVGG